MLKLNSKSNPIMTTTTSTQSTQTDLNQLDDLMSVAKKSLSISMLLDLEFFSALGFPQETAANLAKRIRGGEKYDLKKEEKPEEPSSSSPIFLPSLPLDSNNNKTNNSASLSKSPSPMQASSPVNKLENNNSIKDGYYMNQAIYNGASTKTSSVPVNNESQLNLVSTPESSTTNSSELTRHTSITDIYANNSNYYYKQTNNEQTLSGQEFSQPKLSNYSDDTQLKRASSSLDINSIYMDPRYNQNSTLNNPLNLASEYHNKYQLKRQESNLNLDASNMKNMHTKSSKPNTLVESTNQSTTHMPPSSSYGLQSGWLSNQSKSLKHKNNDTIATRNSRSRSRPVSSLNLENNNQSTYTNGRKILIVKVMDSNSAVVELVSVPLKSKEAKNNASQQQSFNSSNTRKSAPLYMTQEGFSFDYTLENLHKLGFPPNHKYTTFLNANNHLESERAKETVRKERGKSAASILRNRSKSAADGGSKSAVRKRVRFLNA